MVHYRALYQGSKTVQFFSLGLRPIQTKMYLMVVMMVMVMVVMVAFGFPASLNERFTEGVIGMEHVTDSVSYMCCDFGFAFCVCDLTPFFKLFSMAFIVVDPMLQEYS
jgi:hypothetical protein